jgi:hypothetical protein
VFIGGLAGRRLERLHFNDKLEAVGAVGSTGTESLLLDLAQPFAMYAKGPMDCCTSSPTKQTALF